MRRKKATLTATVDNNGNSTAETTSSPNVVHRFIKHANDSNPDNIINDDDDGQNYNDRSPDFVTNQFEPLKTTTRSRQQHENAIFLCSAAVSKFESKQHKLSRTISGLLILFLYSATQCFITTLLATVSSSEAISTDRVSSFLLSNSSSSSNFIFGSVKNITNNDSSNGPIPKVSEFIVLQDDSHPEFAKQTSLFDGVVSSRTKRFAPPNMRGFTETQILDELFKNYDNRTRPFGVYPNGTFGGPTRVRVNILLRSISKIDDVRMEYTSTITFREEWVDQRLAYDDGGEHEFLVLSDPNKVWKPDLFFYPEKEGWFHAITTPNVLFRIYSSGRVLYSVRLSMVLSCFMQLHLFPLDYQNCTLDMASYAYTTDDIIFYWKEDNPVQLRENILNLPRFQLENVLTGDCSVKTNTGAYSCLKVELHFLRQLNYFIFQTYVPSIMLVIASWVSFWLDQDAIPARITLGVTTLLTVITSTHSINAKLPPVSYTKAIDVWTGACTFFVFAALIEFALVNYASRRERPPAPPGGKRALRKRGPATSMRHRNVMPQPQLPQQISTPYMPLSHQLSPSHFKRQQSHHQPLQNVYSDMDSETALFLANSNNNNTGFTMNNDISNQFVDTMMQPQDTHNNGGGGTPRETSFHRFPAPGEEDLFDFTGGPHLRITGPLSSPNNRNNHHQRLSNRNSGNRMNNVNEVGANFFCDTMGRTVAPSLTGRQSRNSVLASAADCGGLFAPPPPLTNSMSPAAGEQFFNQTMQPSSAASGAFRRGTTTATEQVDATTAARRRGLIGKYFRWPASKAKKIDFVSRVLFPALFLMFNCIYWSVYLTARDRFRRGQNV